MNYHSDNEKGTLQPKGSILSIDPVEWISIGLAGIAIDAALFK